MLLAEHAPNEVATAETEAAMERLTKVVAFQAGVPTSVGSGTSWPAIQTTCVHPCSSLGELQLGWCGLTLCRAW